MEEANIEATQEQVAIIADVVRGAHENYGMAHGYDCAPNPLKLENERLRRELEAEQQMQTCPDCAGTGTTITYGHSHNAVSRCDSCRGRCRR
jgi:DnaJ-class molecular chaperone